jgi:hypothetical protein
MIPSLNNVMDLTGVAQPATGDSGILQNGMQQVKGLGDFELMLKRFALTNGELSGLAEQIPFGELPDRNSFAGQQAEFMQLTGEPYGEPAGQGRELLVLQAESLGSFNPAINQFVEDQTIVQDPDNITNRWGLPPQPLITSGYLQELISNYPVELSDGAYTVLSSETTNGNLMLQVENSDQPGQKIHISIPVETLLSRAEQAIDRGVQSASTRLVKVDSFVSPSLRTPAVSQEQLAAFGKLIQENNLSSIEITQIPVDESPNSGPKAVEVSLVLETESAQSVIKARLQSGEIKARVAASGSLIRTSGMKEADSDTRLDILSGNSLSDRHVDRQASREGTEWNRMPGGANHSGNRPGDLLMSIRTNPEPLTQGTASQGALASAAVIPEAAGSGAVTHDSTQQAVTQVRFSLPEKIEQLAKPNGQTINIRIEPDHLGPARLQLTVRNDVLIGRVMVDSVQAKAVVEGNLDQLTEQLNRVGLKVESIDVNVTGGNPEFSSFSRHQRQMLNRQSATRITSKQYDVEPIESLVSEKTPVAAYVSRDGVNLLA